MRAPQAVPREAPPPAPDTVVCPRCNAGNWRSNRICVRCGTPLPAPPAPTVAGSEDSTTVPKLGEYLVRYGFITQEHLENALRRQQELNAKGTPKKLGEVLLEMKAISPQRLEYAVRQQQRDFYAAFNE
jgi:hypothetical protein